MLGSSISRALVSALLLIGLPQHSAAAEQDVQAIHDALEHEAASNSSLLWGTYRPQVYFGMRPRLPKSLITGLIWSSVRDYRSALTRLRHECSDQDGLGGYRWLYHDGRTFGVQTIDDVENNIRIETSFLKTGHHHGEQGKVDGGSWAARIKGTILDASKDIPMISPIFYAALESEETSTLGLENDEELLGFDHEEAVTFSGRTPDIGEFTIRIEEPKGAHERFINVPVAGGPHGDDFKVLQGKTSYLGAKVPQKDIWRAKEIILTSMNSKLKALAEKYGEENMPSPAFTMLLPNDVMSGANFFAAQKVFAGEFSFDVFFDPASTPKGARLDTQSFDVALNAAKKAFDARFEHQFGLQREKGYLPSMVSFAREVTSSLLGGIGYWHGAGVVDRSFAHSYDADGAEGGGRAEDVLEEDQAVPDPQFTEEMSLMSATPSRSIFPRGFYWDEGFHLAHIGVWDNDLSLEILKSWIALIDEDGWVGREQGLGDEARSRIPEKFQAQNPRYGNPPTFTAALAQYIDRLVSVAGKTGSSLESFPDNLVMSGSTGAQALFSAQHTGPNSTFDSSDEGLRTAHLRSGALARSYLKQIYKPLKRHYEWFRRTQRGELKRWGRTTRSRSNEAYRWRGRTATHVLTSGLDDYPRAKTPHSGELHLDLQSWMGFFAEMMRKVAEVLGEEDDVSEFEKHRSDIVSNLEELFWSEEQKMFCDLSVDDDEDSFPVCHRGYVSLFPLLLRLLPADSPKLGAILDLLSDPEHLWSDYGIRSLSLQDEYFGKDENYWRGPIWIPMQYLALGALKKRYMVEEGPYQDRAKSIYRRLRKNVVENIHKEYVRTGYTWEQYNPTTGEGQRGHPFTGWTSTVALMMAEIY
ncbi:Processing alpha glucosidase I [Tilletia horrida]|uniref:Mannosyl-oligosaccharide glucosidase n=1 Tax=Tilletia horrida TaxID=155126 RepID=A0AAN6GN69_9BASI|nr:Processing alpha glucosidase I [Tilletia horrida]KAK0546330.1 Processing alpha glucosidase I [Tilletia horrida]